MARVAAGVRGTRAQFEDVDGLMEDLRMNQRMFSRGENLLVRMLAMTHMALAQEKSRGPVTPQARGYRDPGGRARMILGTASGYSGARPWGIPVRRVTGEYYRGWKMRRIGQSIYEVYNDSREAFFIEFGINPRATGVIRRPILKMTTIGTLRFIQRTKLIDRFAESTIGSTRNKRGQYQSFMARMAGSSLLGVHKPEGKLPG